MFALGFLVVLVVIAVSLVVTAAVRGSRAGPPGPTALPVPLHDQLARWQEEGLLTGEQVEAIVAHERVPSPWSPPARPAPVPFVRRERRVPAAVEALGYLGGILAAVGVVLLVARWWTDLGLAGRLLVTGFGVVVLTGAGLVLRDTETEPALARLRSFLWLLGSVAAGALGAVVVREVFDTRAPSTVVCGVAGAVLVHSALLWRGRAAWPVQQLVALTAALVTVTAAVMTTGHHGMAGLALVTAALVMVAVGITHRSVHPVIAIDLGAVATVVGGAFVSDRWQGAGLLVALTASCTWLALGVTATPVRTKVERVGLGIIGAVTLPMSLPTTLGWFARDAGIVTGLVTAAVGAGVLMTGVSDRVHLPHVVEMVGGVAVLGGVALMATQSVGLATLAGLVVSVAFVALGMVPGRVLLSVVGCLGLMVNVPWTIGWFFPGEGRVPLLILVAGASIVGVAVLLSRMAGRFRRELHHHGI